MRYRISKYIEFLRPEVYLNVQDNISVWKDRTIIKDIKNHRTFLVNSTIETFIRKFTVAKTCSEVTEEVATEVNASVDELKKVISSFFNYLKHRQFIVPGNTIEKEDDITTLFNIGAIIDQYKIEQVLHFNEDLDVYQALDVTTDQSVVVKLLKRLRNTEVKALRREYNFLKMLGKTGCTPAAYTFIENADYAYFTQEFVEGLRLTRFIRTKKSSSKKLILNIVAEIIKAFEKIHAENIVHGDIHPSNIIVTNQATIKLIDFGLSIHQELDKNELVDFGGVYFFMPPERIRKTTNHKFTRQPDFYSDVFQIGVVLYLLIYNVYPFDGITWEELATEIKEKQVEFPLRSQYRFLVPQWLIDIIAKCISKKPKERFANAQVLYQAFSVNRVDNVNKARSTVKIQ